ncbi:MAG: hypothetical protein JRJ19_10040 [Deltaproteobacteria bacterium]|nr:hypothetical protein [Deltaproteobacteria bacterium]MBW1872395.1 hypothetical protein [Deltaproteobacteria bacterium]
MRKILITCLLLVLSGVMAVLVNCGSSNEANQQKIGAECTKLEDCDDDNPETEALECILDFKGGYCGRKDCVASTDCPEGSLCADYEAGLYCFLVCTDKVQCNQNRTLDNESNCSSNIDPVEGGEDKLCIPPAGD